MTGPARNVVTLGETRHEGDKQQPILLDVDESKHGFLTGTTGSGKSNTLRVIVEEVRGVKTWQGGKAHVAVFETEGDLRPALETLGDFVIFDCDGPLQISPETASLIARQQVELGFDAIYDLTDWGVIDRGLIIAAYSQALSDLKLEHSPRAYGRKLFVFYDEAQKYAPELNKQQKGVNYPAAPAIIDLVSVGRKRGISAWVASQRPAKVRADIRAECDIIIAGKLNRSEDRDTVLKEMGIAASERGAIAGRMRRFKKGDCIIIGEGLFDEPTSAHIKKGRTEVPEDYGVKARETPPMSEAMKQIVAQLADIKQQAAKEVRDLDEARAYIAEVERENERLKLAQKESPTPILQGVPREEVDRLVDAAMRRAEDHVHAEWVAWADEEQSRHYAIQKSIETALNSMPQRHRPGNRGRALGDNTPETPPRAPRPSVPEERTEMERGRFASTENPPTSLVRAAERRVLKRAEGGKRTRAERLLDTLVTLEAVPGLEVDSNRLATVYGVHPRGGSYLQELKNLRDAGLVEYERGVIRSTSAGKKAAKPAPLPRSMHELASWAGLEARTQRVFETIVEMAPRFHGARQPVTKSEIAEKMGVHERGGSFLQEFKRLADRGLIEQQGGKVHVAAWIASVVR